MMKFIVLIYVFLLLACASSRTRKLNDAPSYLKENMAKSSIKPNEDLDLTSQLRRLPGVKVSGSGAGAIINVRSASSLNSSTAPLFIVGNNQIRDYAAVYSLVDVRNIQSIQVLRDPSETSFYGVTGANGVIVIRLKVR